MNRSPGTALITGASSGIGRELAIIHAARGGDVVIVARRMEALEKLKSELEQSHTVSVHCIAADLIEPDAPSQVCDQLEQRGIKVDVLINNAGFGGHGKFHERDWQQDRAMIQLNVTALCDLTHRCLQGMVKRGQGKVLNVASTAGMLPGPLQAVYYATKAFVLSYSQAIAEELRGTGVTVTALCPGPVATEFVKNADLDGVGTFDAAASPESVARIGYQAMEQGRLIAINDRRLSLMLNWIVPWLPRRTLLRISRQSMEKSSH